MITRTLLLLMAIKRIATARHEPIDYPLWDRLMAAYEVINQLKPSLGGVHAIIEEFAIEADWSVEITLGKNGAPGGGHPTEASTP